MILALHILQTRNLLNFSVQTVAYFNTFEFIIIKMCVYYLLEMFNLFLSTHYWLFWERSIFQPLTRNARPGVWPRKAPSQNLSL